MGGVRCWAREVAHELPDTTYRRRERITGLPATARALSVQDIVLTMGINLARPLQNTDCRAQGAVINRGVQNELGSCGRKLEADDVQRQPPVWKTQLRRARPYQRRARRIGRQDPGS